MIRTGVKAGGGLIVKVAICEPLFNVEVIVTDACDLTARDVIVNVVVAVLAGTVTLAGTVAAEGLPLVSITTIPPGGANPLRVTVPVELAAPPTTVAGFKVRDVRAVAAGFTESVA